MTPKNRKGRFLSSFGRGFGVYSTSLGHKLRAGLFFIMAMAACWLTIVPGYVWVVEPGYRIAGAAKWSMATILTQSGLPDWKLSVKTIVGKQRWRAAYIHDEPWHMEQGNAVIGSLYWGAAIATVTVTVFGIAAVAILRRKGRNASKSRIVRGRTITSDRELASSLKRERIHSELTIGRVPLIRPMEAYGTLLLGAQGTGKTSAIERLMKGIQDRGEPMVVFDYGPGLMPRFFNKERGDVILNPLDARTAKWSPWSEIKSTADCASIAEGFIPENNPHDPFWGIAGRLLFGELLDCLRMDEDRSVKKLLHVLLRMPREEIREMVKYSNAVKLYQEGAERTGGSVEINTSVYVRALSLLDATAGSSDDFSINRYIAALDEPAPSEGRPWLWMPADAKSSAILSPLITCWTNAVANALLTLPERPDRRLWLMLDELATLQQMPALQQFLSNGRKRGGCAVLALQSPLQLHGIYKHEEADAILNGCQTHAVFRINDAKGAEWASRQLGQVELEEVRESARLGAGGGGGQEVHLSVDTRVSPTVLPTEIAMLKNSRCYVKLTEDQPLALTQVKPRPPLASNEPTEPLIPWASDSHMAGEVLKAEGINLDAAGSSKDEAGDPKPKERASPTQRNSRKQQAPVRHRNRDDEALLRPQPSEQQELFSQPPRSRKKQTKTVAWTD